MTSIDPTALEEYGLLERRFWQILQRTFSHVLYADLGPLDSYRASLSRAPPYERLLALHDDPLDVAAVLTGVTLTPEINSRYTSLLSETFTDEVVDAPPYWRFGNPKLQARESQREIRLVSVSEFAQIMERLGYVPAEQDMHTFVWQRRSPFPGLPETVASVPLFRSPSGELQPVYTWVSVLEIYNNIIALAAHNRAPPETMKMLLEERDNFIKTISLT